MSRRSHVQGEAVAPGEVEQGGRLDLPNGTPNQLGLLLARWPRSGSRTSLVAREKGTRMRLPATYKGSCHCGAVRFVVETDLPELTTCDCSICSKKNALMVKVHESKLKLLKGTEHLTEYQFHTRTARHYFCNVCGIYPFHRKRVTPEFFGVNVYCLEGVDPAGIPVKRARGKHIA